MQQLQEIRYSGQTETKCLLCTYMLFSLHDMMQLKPTSINSGLNDSHY